MGQIIASFLIILFIIFTFIPLAALNDNHFEIQCIKQNLNLASRAVCNSIENSVHNYEGISEGYEKSLYTEMEIDKERLLSEFYDVLGKNYYNSAEFEKVKNRIYLKILVYNDRFYIADKKDKWTPPYFFNIYLDGNIKDIGTVSISSDEVCYYDEMERVYKQLDHADIQITAGEKNEIIIDKLNQIISQYTYDPDKKRSFNIRIRNPKKADIEYKLEYRNFNVLDGITFFVLYAEDENVYIDNKSFDFKNYNVTGYTFTIKE